MAYQLNGTTHEHDEEGYITEIGLWSRDLAELIAEVTGAEIGKGKKAAAA